MRRPSNVATPSQDGDPLEREAEQPDFSGLRMHDDRSRRLGEPDQRYPRNITPAAVDFREVIGDTTTTQLLGRITASRISDAAGSARDLGPGETVELERQFGRDLPDVRVHEGAAARDAAMLLGARAFTIGRDIYFGSPMPSQALLAHEVAHTIQQRDVGSVSGTIAVAPRSAPSERAAASGSATSLAPVSAPALQRDEDPNMQRILDLFKDPGVVQRVQKALDKGRDLSGVLNEELLNVEIVARLSTGRGSKTSCQRG